MEASSKTTEIDDSLYSRQRYVLGDSAMQRMAGSSVLLVGLGGIGIEIAKNIALAGVKSLTIQDDTLTSVSDLATQFFLREDDAANSRNRCEASLPRVAELNPYVTVRGIQEPFQKSAEDGWNFLRQYQCVILTGHTHKVQIEVDEFCRTQNPPISFISADVFGVFCSCFCDFGDKFEIFDDNGEEIRETFISNISKENPGMVTSLENRIHGLEDGQTVTFKEVKGMTELNGKTCQIKVISPYTFSICDTSDFTPYQHGGICVQVKTSSYSSFQSLQQQLMTPSLLTPDLSRMQAPMNIHVGVTALHRYIHLHSNKPKPWCLADADVLLELARTVVKDLKMECSLDEDLIRQLAFTSEGCFAPLCTALGGIVAQEVLKALTGKFTPLNQWLYFDSTEVLCSLEEKYTPLNDRYDPLRICVGNSMCKKLADLKLFMVGCGAIGCEMLKNYAMLGISSSTTGQIIVTDNDLIEKSNLNRQFLFRSHHIQQPKSKTAASSILEINNQLHIEAHQHLVCPQTESTAYPDRFFEQLDVAVNALDNLQARRYMDGRCVSNQKPLLESGTMGAKGHVQVIIPHLTESYTSQQDPVDEDVPYCTLKSFPATIQHCIQWARERFLSSFTQKPESFNKFWSEHSQHEEVSRKLATGCSMDGALQACKLLSNRPSSWSVCVNQARVKFEKNFNHKAKQLLHAFPLDRKLTDGTLFWQSPKRPPVPVEFNDDNTLHMSYIVNTARLIAGVHHIIVSSGDLALENIKTLLKDVKVPEFRPSTKAIVTDETVKREEAETVSDSCEDELEKAARQIDEAQTTEGAFNPLYPLSFEKDDDENGHIDFITAASNLRAAMYNIESADRLKTKKIAGRIVPAIATTTAAVAGLVTVELVKVTKQSPLEHYKNCFLNLALPVLIFSEPAPAPRTVIKEGVSITLWDKWIVKGHKDYTMQEFLSYFKSHHGVVAVMVVQGVRMVYVPMVMASHKKRLTQPMIKLLKATPGQAYVDLVVSFENDAKEEVEGPPVRYFFNS